MRRRLLTRRQEIVICVEVVEKSVDGNWCDEPFGAAVVEVVGCDMDAN